MSVIVIGTLPSSLINFRGQLLLKLKKESKLVTAIASGATEQEIESLGKLGCRFVDYPVARSGLSPIKDIITFSHLVRIFKRLKPSLILAYTIKPIIWGGIASRFLPSTSFYALVTGLGYAFQPGGRTKSLLIWVVRNLYKLALENSKAVIFQNPDNMNIFIQQGIVPKNKCYLVNGSGVDLSLFESEPLTARPSFLLIARLLGDKGIREYAKAAEIVKSQYPHALFSLVGPEDPSPDRIDINEIHQLHESGVLTYHGATNDVRPFIKESSVFVLPSYHEGMPRTVLEAMAMGRPILTTNVPGCRETVVNGENGWLVEKANVEQLAERMIWFIENQEQWSVMGNKSHAMANEKFDVHKVNAEILKIMGLSDEKTV
ncbi:galacturonosyltransferase WbtD [Vibrio crassostreae]|uniref:Glycosyl transferase group 1 n=1 Tax=Vibrio crassostreae TaxID=246167 RepID=A0A822N7L6_9VIBR|nr:glycosyltransferase family 4 protein [Vibrio crassostreae]MDH5952841.1 glycosyltransferase family 4 protein [Vibrio crassostreae]ROR17236.1 glycosyltransferase involved in cell wall biosynthesis [Vibrio crassostreae]TCN07173.1 glycosyltransferase involved in cell wall biosynthesis [Vibrio crassostreae]TCU07551.1 glycosyltransferase involved in cell wall biosynthesis [Vibrio crassostreae]CAK2209288.1 galacturonosyltransferase WbtD [Vibrio crassostreae]